MLSLVLKVTTLKFLPFIFLLFFSTPSIYAQHVDIDGVVESNSEVENIHVINKTAQFFTITDQYGAFTIQAKLNDTIVFSSIQHILKKIVIDELTVSTQKIIVVLEDYINTLDEVIVGKVLTGDLFSDMKNINLDNKPINFMDVGIPGYTGKIATQSERRLSEASSFKPRLGGGVGGAGVGVGFTPIINAITGRTKMLKNRVKIEEKEALMRRIKARLKKDFLASNPLEEEYVMDFFYFCSDDVNFIKRCRNKSDFDVLIFLRFKYRQYLENRKAN